MSQQNRLFGVIETYRDRLPMDGIDQIVTLGEGATPLVPAPRLGAELDATVWVKVEGANPTGSFKDRGMTMAMTKALPTARKPWCVPLPVIPLPRHRLTPPEPA